MHCPKCNSEEIEKCPTCSAQYWRCKNCKFVAPLKIFEEGRLSSEIEKEKD